MDIVTRKTSRPSLVEEVGYRKHGALPLRRWWQTLGVATTLLCAANIATAATFSLSNGDIIEGEIVQATRNTLVIREKIGGMRQLSRHQMESMRVETKKGQTISGPLMSWKDGVYEIEYGGRLIQVRERKIVSVVPIPPKQTVAEAETVVEPASSEPETEQESAPAEVAALPSEPLSSASAAAEIVTPQAEPDEPALSGVEGEAPPKLTELATAAVGTETPEPMPADPEASAHEDALPPPKLTISEVQAAEDASELVFKLDLSRPVDQPIMILYATYDKTAVAGEDYKGERGTMTLAPGTSSAVVRVPLIDDNVLEENETFELFVATDERHATIETDRIVGTILNDDK